jgi:FlaA1/EpsC-like NDP-sugar epimerase
MKYFLVTGVSSGIGEELCKSILEENIENFQETEVSKLEWKNLEQCLESIRPYNLEKKQLITNINKVLQEYRLYS